MSEEFKPGKLIFYSVVATMAIIGMMTMLETIA